MITAEYCRMMARYNRWQNNGIRDVVRTMGEDDLTKDRGAFFGSIFRTLNHLLWGDQLWLMRFGVGGGPAVDADKHDQLTDNIAEWDRLRFITDGQIMEWAGGLHAVDLAGDMEWRSALFDKTLTQPIGLCVTHFFNHQTHHRGQVHAMLTAAGQVLPDTDLTLMPES